ncbi:MAG TPA: branched-chain amino acid ABC transporter ATP-binding protein/permease [Nocardioides sp.]|jgi:branched-chain amino acid transport system permease protein|nr:branched-chain amino acid ABC transporter ATP-binding protein/permease [Nocardioides sp.]
MSAAESAPEARRALDPIWLGRGIALVAGVLLVLYPMLSDNLYYQNMIILSLVFAIAASGLSIITGLAGYVSLSQGAFVGLGGYTVGVLATHHPDTNVWLWMPVAGVTAGLVALILGFVAMRASGPSFVIITVAFLFLVQVIAINWRSVSGGTEGLSLPIPTWDADIANWPFYYSLVGILALQLLLTWWIRRTKLGTGLVAIRDDETKAATLGINLPVEKMIAFIASSVLVGVGGGVYGYYLTFIDPRGMFNILLSVEAMLALLVGGKATLWGPVLGAFIVEPLNEYANNNLGGGNTRLLLFGGLLVLIVLFLPQGVLPAIESLLNWVRTRGRAGLVGARIGTGGSLASLTGRLSLVDRAAAVDPPPPLLEVKDLRKAFGGLKAVDGASLVVPEGSITGLIGPNGSGKTTLFNLIDDTIHADGGEIWLAGERIDRLSPWTRAHRGLGRTFQITRLFREMTVLENVVAAQRSFSWGQLGRIAVSGSEARAAEELLEYVGMRSFRDQKARALSFGQQKLVELAQVLMLDPKLILLDEPAGGINPVLIDRMSGMIRELNSYGKTFLIVEHNMPFVLGLCDPVHVLARGHTMASGTPDQIQKDPAVVDAYLGDDFVLEDEHERTVR